MDRVPSLARFLTVHSSGFLFLIVVSVSTAAGLMALHYDSNRRAEKLQVVVQDIYDVHGDLYRQLKEVFDYVFLGDPEALDEFEILGQGIEAKLTNLGGEGGAPGIADKLSDLSSAYDAVRARARSIMNQTHGGFAPGELLKLFEEDLEEGDMRQYELAFAATEAVVALARADLQRRNAGIRDLAIAGLAVTLLVGLGLLFLSRRLLRRQIAEPVNRLLRAVDNYRGGRLEHSVPETGPAEFLQLQAAFNRMTGRLRESQEALVRAEKQAATGALVPIVAHNIRNPLASIRATAQLMQEPNLNEEQREGTDAIVRTVDRLDNWLSQFMTYLNPVSPNVSPTSLSTIVDHALQLLDHSLREKRIEIERQTDNRETALEGDQNLLEQAVCGLLSNAIEASPPGAKVVFCVSEDDAERSLVIRDFGPGMPFLEGPSGFTPGPTTKSLGSGLGVPFARKICEIHGGVLEFHLAPEGGTLASIRLPKQDPAEAVRAEASQRGPQTILQRTG